MQTLDIITARLDVTMARYEARPLPGWIAEVAKRDPRNPPSGSLADFRRALPDTVPEIAELPPWTPRRRWQFWRNRPPAPIWYEPDLRHRHGWYPRGDKPTKLGPSTRP